MNEVIRPDVMWPNIFAKLPWVKYIKAGKHDCERYRNKAPMMMNYPNRPGLRRVTPEELEALRKKFKCKNSARWVYKPLKKSMARGGTLCWVHMLAEIDMDEEVRIRKWLDRHHPELTRGV
jgi:hypothetical protein